MYNFLMSAAGWEPNRGSMSVSRFYAQKDKRYKASNGVVSPALLALPALLMPEVDYQSDQVAHVATIHSAKLSSDDVIVDYTIDSDIGPLPVLFLVEHATELAISTSGFMLQHTHWDVNDADLFRTLLRIGTPKPPEPTVFKVDHTKRKKQTVGVMMPFGAEFNDIYAAIRKAATAAGYTCNRADDIWRHPQIMQTIVSLICEAGIVIVDCTGRNPNVFYEAGIAHSLGRDVILIAQSIEDVPFDLRHLHIIKYLSNRQGLDELTAKLKTRIPEVAATQTWG